MEGRINQKSLAEHIVEDLEQKIIVGILQPGQRIIEEALCKTYGVSRSPVREAFHILESQGFVIREPRRGISVAEITPREAEEIYRIRASLEGLAMSLAVAGLIARGETTIDGWECVADSFPNFEATLGQIA